MKRKKHTIEELKYCCKIIRGDFLFHWDNGLVRWHDSKEAQQKKINNTNSYHFFCFAGLLVKYIGDAALKKHNKRNINYTNSYHFLFWCSSPGFDELTCHCGAEVMYPPIPCGTMPPECHRPCTRDHGCNHPGNSGNLDSANIIWFAAVIFCMSVYH